jgi:maltose phosphorylase
MTTVTAAEKAIQAPLTLGYDQLLQDQIDAWAKIWDMSDITIDGDVKHNKEFVSIFFN